MQNDNYKIVATRDQLDVIYNLVSIASRLPVKGIEHKLLISHMIDIHKKVIPKWSYPKNKNVISLSVPQALAFYLMFSNEDFINPFQFATMNPVLTDIHRKYS